MAGISKQPPFTIALATNIEHHRSFLTTFHENLWIAITAGIAFTVIFGWIAAHRGLSPVREMTNVAKGVSVSHLGERLSLEAIPTELVDLAIAFNEMLERQGRQEFNS